MLVFEIVTPGTWLEHQDKTWARDAAVLVEVLKASFFDANLALNLFMESSGDPAEHPDDWEADHARRREIERVIEQEMAPASNNERAAVYFEAEARLKREKWANGQLPRQFSHRLAFLYAQAFLHALDKFEKTLRILAQDDKAPDAIRGAVERMLQGFPALRGVRNTDQHIEDRIRGLDARGRQMELQPITTSAINAPMGGVLALQNLNGSKYGSVMSDGNHGEVDVSPASMEELKSILDAVLQSFAWTGPPSHDPH